MPSKGGDGPTTQGPLFALDKARQMGLPEKAEDPNVNFNGRVGVLRRALAFTAQGLLLDARPNNQSIGPRAPH